MKSSRSPRRSPVLGASSGGKARSIAFTSIAIRDGQRRYSVVLLAPARMATASIVNPGRPPSANTLSAARRTRARARSPRPIGRRSTRAVGGGRLIGRREARELDGGAHRYGSVSLRHVDHPTARGHRRRHVRGRVHPRPSADFGRSDRWTSGLSPRASPPDRTSCSPCGGTRAGCLERSQCRCSTWAIGASSRRRPPTSAGCATSERRGRR